VGCWGRGAEHTNSGEKKGKKKSPVRTRTKTRPACRVVHVLPTHGQAVCRLRVVRPVRMATIRAVRERGERTRDASKQRGKSHSPPQKKGRRACAADADAGSMRREGGNGWRGSGDRAVTPARPCHHRFLCRVSSGVGVLAVGGVVAEVRTGQDTAKKGPLTWRGDSEGR